MSSYPAGTVLLKGHIDVPADRLEQVSAALVAHIDLTRSERGCLFFNVDPCDVNAQRFIVSEAFVDQDAFDAHQKRAGSSPWAEVSTGIPREYEITTVE